MRLASALLLSVLLALPAMSLAQQTEPIVIKVASIAPDGTPWAEQLRDWKRRLEKASGGRLKIKTYLGGALGDENVTVQETRRGAIQVFGGSTAALASSVPEIAVVELPYLFRDNSEVDYILDEVIFDDVSRILEARGFKMLFWAENGWRSMATRFGCVKTPEDLKGKKMRSQESDVHLEMYRALGASPVPIAATEVLSSLQTGVVEGFDNTPLFAFASSWYQGITHFTTTRHIYQPGIVVMSMKTYQSLPDDLKKIVVGDPKAEAVKGRKGVRALEPLLLENFGNAGKTVCEFPESSRKLFEARTRVVHDYFRKKRGKKASQLLDKIEKALAARRAAAK
ncbi:MAG: TRAP transporter substrate-binding protein [Deltaproteobacteria bacterium]|nr:MAG: TRAP transporter substrate-binding protein [Deltaproteobacteria bacterium]